MMISWVKKITDKAEFTTELLNSQQNNSDTDLKTEKHREIPKDIYKLR